MEEFRKTLQKRIRFIMMYNSVMVILLVQGVFHMTRVANEHASDFISGYSIGFCVALQILGIALLGKYRAALKNEEKFNALYIKENDERKKFIKTKMGDVGSNITIVGLCLATIISGYFNATVFFTLMGTLFFTMGIKIVLKIIYTKKY